VKCHVPIVDPGDVISCFEQIPDRIDTLKDADQAGQPVIVEGFDQPWSPSEEFRLQISRHVIVSELEEALGEKGQRVPNKLLVHIVFV